MNNTDIRPIDKTKIVFALSTGLLLTGSFPKTGRGWLAWLALVPLLIALRNVSVKNAFRLGLLSGLAHYLTLLYWLAYTMNRYGHIPLYLGVPILLLFAAYLALYTGAFSAIVVRFSPTPLTCVIMIPWVWVSMEYIRTFLFSGFPWELVGYSQFNRLLLIQIADILGVYGVSFLVMLSNGAIFLVFL
ncbi:MAG: apolipoprotein N-acyltransferase, partial [Deltaproteobacteria bacterium]|nr:apolipoprotein N-acyltransferase [Deltaproteobacteria bacterium]